MGARVNRPVVGVPAVVRPEVCNAVQATSIMKYLLTYPTHFEHDFTRQSVCEIPVQLVMKNASGHDTIHVCVNFLPPSATQGEGAELTVPVTSRFAWVNKSISTCTIPADSSVTTETVVTCVTPGVYDLTRLRLTARVRDEEVFVVQPTPGQYLVTVTPKLD
ncbi:hypothetical protein SARC_08955 [Sphaeroforma arctica JP610]|uniref:TPPC8 C-terminal Ig-like domain-containing protein n=1 Tax=Sphaeroforma arctica JP610 TaxID=667725 RepID=A0A0L0FP92_9EUKA|nr:hypothetical protein SARC_08955 [Sphaeroforma arctica JP610]KNC78625.1 hypothetical protein SARC_08955 [Sphaeroforma arctica JP610]|eukprot:XP_014152527.1 hypothetical protein SARC_08955 [Sphaeroforma arctica JP610]